MARTKEFDRDEAVRRAMQVFWEQGYEATSTDDLLRAMGIGRQSMYDTFGDKHGLYLEALRAYQAEYSANLVECLRSHPSPLSAIREYLLSIPNGTQKVRARGCLFVNATAELAHVDTEVATLLKTGGALGQGALERVVKDAQRKGELNPRVDPGVAASFLLATIGGLRLSAKAGTPPDALRDVVDFAMAGLRAQ
ncbi:TetR/AcrR family transcriptional regulator [Corallococcus exiguus]|uniref:TetR/AcrR family transcriptional regulator n=1 Tax=Corallococcus TaxID=83461 RepID=UPI000F85EF6C|nr:MULTISPECIES: TetR/AcrR family transcriptional regulator [Corallococcus]NNC18501.1 TetR/AcrR family transcriptional regulator [Corallococcus exiguus]NRD62864.1 TetR/AcrR family transcriptional regulator [Corallococcus exiguus]RUO89225.1 TetR/AcrR family transcriptional regulator [Corallococcus sp. AB018]